MLDLSPRKWLRRGRALRHLDRSTSFARDDNQSIRIAAEISPASVLNATLNHCTQQASARGNQCAEQWKIKAARLLDGVWCRLAEHMIARVDRDFWAVTLVNLYWIQFEIGSVRCAVRQNPQEILQPVIRLVLFPALRWQIRSPYLNSRSSAIYLLRDTAYRIKVYVDRGHLTIQDGIGGDRRAARLPAGNCKGRGSSSRGMATAG